MASPVALLNPPTAAPPPVHSAGAERLPVRPVRVRVAAAPVGAWAGRHLPHLLAGVFFALYAALSVRKHRRIESNGFDLGIFEQSVRSYAHGRPPVSDIRGLNLLGDHFSPVVATLAPFYRLFPGPVTLLVAQALLMALSVVPVTRYAAARFGDRTALAVGLGYGLSWGLQQAVAFDFHEIAFAVPLLAFTAVALAEGGHRAAIGWALPLVLVKEDLGLTVAAVGAYLFLRGRRWLGAVVAAVGVGCTALTMLVLLPAANPTGHYEYAGNVTSTLPGADGWPVKLGTLALLLAPTAFVALRSPLLVLTLPTLAWRFAAHNPNYWGTIFHYSAVLMPVVFVAFVHGLELLGATTRTRARRVAVVAGLVFSVVLAGQQPLARLAEPGYWHDDQVTAGRYALLAQIPDGVTVTATNQLAPQLTARCRVRMASPTRPVTTEWVIMDVRRGTWPLSLDQTVETVDALTAAGYRRVDERDGVVLLRR